MYVCQIPPPGFRAPKKINDKWEVSRSTEADSSDRQDVNLEKGAPNTNHEPTNDQDATSAGTAPQPTSSNAGKENEGAKNMRQSNKGINPNAPPSTPPISVPPINEIETAPVTDGLISTPQPPISGARLAYGGDSDGSQGNPEYNIMKVEKLDKINMVFLT